MKTGDLKEALGCRLLNEVALTREIEAGYTSDLLSDVMAHAPENSVLITIQGHKNTVAVAALTGITAILLCGGRPAPEDMLEAAAREKIAVFSTADNQFTASCKIGGLLQG